MKYKQGLYKIKNIEKYISSKTARKGYATYRSSWERIAFLYMDKAKHIYKWGSESIIIPYKFRLDQDDRFRRYYMDLYFEDSYGKHMVEIKPRYKTDRETIMKGGSKGLIAEYIQNEDKWSATLKYAKLNNMTFQIWTEDHISKIKHHLVKFK